MPLFSSTTVTKLNAFCICVLLSCLSACATHTPNMRAAVFQDELFLPKSPVISASELFAISPEMRRYLDGELATRLQKQNPANALHSALYQELELKLKYDADRTFTAQEAFAARAGNCLSLVIMTGALARGLGLDVYFHAIDVEENWLQKGSLIFSSGHVNVTIGRNPPLVRMASDKGRFLTIDFAPVENGRRAIQLTEQSVVALYMNNRAAENLALGKHRDAYWWAKAAITSDASLLPAYNTLAVIYRNSGHTELAASTLKTLLLRDPNNIPALSNLAIVLAKLDQTVELASINARLKKLRTHEPYYFFRQGKLAMQAGNFQLARDLFLREIKRQPDNHQFYFQLALAYAGLGDARQTAASLAKALEYSTTLAEQGIYSAKLSKLRQR
jgi:hypothetical protein